MVAEREYVAVLIMVLVAAVIPALFVSVGRFLGPRKPSVAKSEPFECGNPASGPAWGRFSVKFYLTAILFIVFDIEVVFLYPWAVSFDSLGIFGLVEMVLFIATVFVAYAYVWRRGGLEWD